MKKSIIKLNSFKLGFKKNWLELGMLKKRGWSARICN